MTTDISKGAWPATAPDISKGYPSGGERLWPAWQTMWDYLVKHRGKWLDGPTLAKTGGTVEVPTAQTLLRKAADRKLIERQYIGPHRRAWYRLPEQPELFTAKTVSAQFSVACPECRAEPFTVCTTPTGRTRGPHVGRRLAHVRAGGKYRLQPPTGPDTGHVSVPYFPEAK